MEASKLTMKKVYDINMIVKKVKKVITSFDLYCS